MSATFDARPLTDPVDPRAVAAFTREMKARHPNNSAGMIIAIVLGVVVLVPLLGIMLTTGVVLAFAFTDGVGGFIAGFLILLVFAGLITLGVVKAVQAGRLRGVERYRVSRFAAANNMAYVDRIDDPPLPGMVFQQGSGRMSTDLVRGEKPRFVEFGNYQYTVQSGKNSTTYRWGYVAVKLDVPLPNIVLDATGNNSILGSNLPASFQKKQRLSLEGNFDQYFTLYCPEGYETDALYLFTPDIMARFIDNVAHLDVEIVDDWLFLYTRTKASTIDPRTWAWLFGAVGALMTKFDQWARWRDERLRVEAAAGGHAVPAALTSTASALPFATPVGLLSPPPGVAQPGRRLRRGVPWLVITFVVVIFVVTSLPTWLGFLGAFLFR